jgi:hypothetical protein
MSHHLAPLTHAGMVAE